MSGNKTRAQTHAGESNAGQPNEYGGEKNERQSRKRSGGTQSQLHPAFPSQVSPSSPTNNQAVKLRSSDEHVESSTRVVRSSSYDGQLSAPAAGGSSRGFSLEAGLPVDEATRRTSAARSGRLAVLEHGDYEPSAHPSPSGLHDSGGRAPQAGSIDSAGEASTAETHRAGEARVGVAFVCGGDEERTAVGTGGGREATVRRSVPPPLRLDNGTLVLGERLGLRRSSPSDLETYEGFDDHGDGEVYARGVAQTRDPKNRRNGVSLEEWAAAARKNGRVNSPAPDTPEPSTRQQRAPSKNNIADKNSNISSSNSNNKHGPILPTLDDLKSARSGAHRALLASNVIDTLEMCQNILQEWPSDGATLLYQGAAMAQSGEWDHARNRMERVLALSSGVEETTTEAASATVGYPAADDSQGGAQSSARHVDAAQPPRASAAATAAAVPLDIALAAAANLASFARARAPETLDSNAETFFLVEGLRGAAERDRVGLERGKVSARSAMPSSERSTLEENGKEGQGGGKAEDAFKAGRIDGFTDILVMMAQALEGKGQLTSALRLYQRAILLGSHRDPRALHGLGGLSHRLLEVERERRRRQSVIHSAEASAQSPFPSPPSLPAPAPPVLDRLHLSHRQTGAGATTSRTSETGSAASKQQRQRQRPSGCEWGISHPKPGQVFSPDDPVQVEFDLSLLDPGLPSAGSLFETVTVGGGTAGAGELLSEEVAQESRGGGTAIVEDGLGVVVCSYLEGFKAAHCLPRGQLRDIGLGWHVLTAEAYQLPSLGAFSCLADGDAARDGRVEHR